MAIRRGRKATLIVAVAALLAAGGIARRQMAAQANTAPCTVAYAVTAQTDDRFTAELVVTILDQSASPWTLQWSFENGQTITNGWNGVFSQTGNEVTVTNARRTASLHTSQATTLGFDATWTQSNPPPPSFFLNGAKCSSDGTLLTSSLAPLSGSSLTSTD